MCRPAHQMLLVWLTHGMWVNMLYVSLDGPQRIKRTPKTNKVHRYHGWKHARHDDACERTAFVMIEALFAHLHQMLLKQKCDLEALQVSADINGGVCAVHACTFR